MPVRGSAVSAEEEKVTSDSCSVRRGKSRVSKITKDLTPRLAETSSVLVHHSAFAAEDTIPHLSILKPPLFSSCLLGLDVWAVVSLSISWVLTGEVL
jgi:hypothetical protein